MSMDIGPIRQRCKGAEDAGQQLPKA